MSIKAISINIVVYVVISTISTLLVCNYTNDINLLDIFSWLEYLAAALKIDEIRRILQEAMAVNLLQEDDEIISANLKNLSVDIQSLYNEKREQGKLNINVIIKHIDEVAMIMQNTSSNIKAKKYGVKV